MEKQFRLVLEVLNNIDSLNSLKIKIKDHVIQKQLTWEDRAELYKMVQLINQRIEQIIHDSV